MINKIEISGNNMKVSDDVKKYAEKHLGKIDKYLPRSAKKDIVLKAVITEIKRESGSKYEISAAMDIPGGKVLAAKDECSNLLAGVDIVETKLVGQIRRFKTETENKKKTLRNLFKKN